MKKKLSLLLSTVMAMNIVSYAGAGVYSSMADEVETVTKLNGDSVKREEVLPSIIKPGVPEKVYLDIDSYSDAVEKIEKDLKTEVNIPVLIGSHRGAVSGKLSKGVGITLYRLTEEESKAKRFTPDSTNLLSDNKYSIDSEKGDFLVSFTKNTLKPGDKIGVCISYSVMGADNKVVNKTYVTEAVYVGVNAQKIGLNGNVDISKAIVGLPAEAKVNIAENIDAATPGSKELKVDVDYENKKTPVTIPVIVANQEAEHVDSSLRISGTNRFGTNIDSIKRNFKAGNVETVIIASGMSFADPLAAGPLAMKLKAPIVFSGNSGLSEEAKNLIDTLGAKNIIIIGGKNTVPETVEAQLNGKNIRRIAGKNRYKTSEMIAEEYGEASHIILADGNTFADALSATPLAKKINSPIVLVKNTNSIPENIGKYRDVYIVGGKSSVSPVVENEVKNRMKDKNVYRVYGSNRSETSTQVAKLTKFEENIMVNGNSFPDALSSVNLLSSGGKNLLLVGKDKASKNVTELLGGKVNYIIGGYSSVSKNILGY